MGAKRQGDDGGGTTAAARRSVGGLGGGALVRRGKGREAMGSSRAKGGMEWSSGMRPGARPPRQQGTGCVESQVVRVQPWWGALLHGRHESNTSSTWQASLCSSWRPFWASSVQIWAKGLKPKLLTTACSTFSIYGV
jgi:hypothetical protein